MAAFVTVGRNAMFGGRGSVFRAGTSTPIIITATSSPVASQIASGATLADMADWATFVNTANYSSTAGTISTVVAKLDGTTRTGTYAPADGSYALTFVVTDSVANERTFNAGTLTVAAASGVSTFDSTLITFDSNLLTFDEAA